MLTAKVDGFYIIDFTVPFFNSDKEMEYTHLYFKNLPNKEEIFRYIERQQELRGEEKDEWGNLDTYWLDIYQAVHNSIGWPNKLDLLSDTYIYGSNGLRYRTYLTDSNNEDQRGYVQLEPQFIVDIQKNTDNQPTISEGASMNIDKEFQNQMDMLDNEYLAKKTDLIRRFAEKRGDEFSGKVKDLAKLLHKIQCPHCIIGYDTCKWNDNDWSTKINREYAIKAKTLMKSEALADVSISSIERMLMVMSELP